MTRLFALALLVAPAHAATVSPIQIKECVQVSMKDLARDAVERVDVCGWPGPFELPPLDLASLDPLALKSTELAVPGILPKQNPGLLSGAGRSMGGGGVSRVGSPSLQSFSDSYASAFASATASCGCKKKPNEEPSPIPLPATTWFMLTFILGAIAWLRSSKRS